MMDTFKNIPKATKTIMFISILLPITVTLYPSLIKHLYYDISFLKLFQIHRLFISVFLSIFDISYILKLITRYQILDNIESQNLRIDPNQNYNPHDRNHRRSLTQNQTIVSSSVELLFFTFTFIIPLFFSNLIEGLNNFTDSIDMAYIKYMCALMPRDSFISFFNFKINSSYFVYYYFFYNIIMSKMRSKCYYGLVYASCYIYFRRNLGGVPDWFVWIVEEGEKIVVRMGDKIRDVINGKYRSRRGRTVRSLNLNRNK